MKNVHGGATPETAIMARIAVTDGMAKAAISVLEKAGHEVVVGHIEKNDLLDGALKDFDAIIVRSATKLPEEVIKVSAGLSVIGRAGVGSRQYRPQGCRKCRNNGSKRSKRFNTISC